MKLLLQNNDDAVRLYKNATDKRADNQCFHMVIG